MFNFFFSVGLYYFTVSADYVINYIVGLIICCTLFRSLEIMLIILNIFLFGLKLFLIYDLYYFRRDFLFIREKYTNRNCIVILKSNNLSFLWPIFNIIDIILIILLYKLSYFKKNKKLLINNLGDNPFTFMHTNFIKRTSLMTIVKHTFVNDNWITNEISFINDQTIRKIRIKEDNIYHSTQQICFEEKLEFEKSCKNFNPAEEFQYIRYRIIINHERIKSISLWNEADFKNLIILNLLNIHLLTPFTNNEKTLYKNVFEIVKNSTEYYRNFSKVFTYLIESFILREDSFQIIEEFFKKLEEPQRIVAFNYLKTILFNNWPPPLWFYSLLKLRQLIRRNLFNKHDLCDVNLKDFILNPFKNETPFSLSSLFNLKYYNLLRDSNLNIGLMNDLNNTKNYLNSYLVLNIHEHDYSV